MNAKVLSLKRNLYSEKNPSSHRRASFSHLMPLRAGYRFSRSLFFKNFFDAVLPLRRKVALLGMASKLKEKKKQVSISTNSLSTGYSFNDQSEFINFLRARQLRRRQHRYALKRFLRFIVKGRSFSNYFFSESRNFMAGRFKSLIEFFRRRFMLWYIIRALKLRQKLVTLATMQIELRRKYKFIKRIKRFYKESRAKNTKDAKRSKKAAPLFYRGVYRRDLREPLNYYRWINILEYYNSLRKQAPKYIDKRFYLDKRILDNNIYKKYYDLEPMAIYKALSTQKPSVSRQDEVLKTKGQFQGSVSKPAGKKPFTDHKSWNSKPYANKRSKPAVTNQSITNKRQAVLPNVAFYAKSVSEQDAYLKGFAGQDIKNRPAYEQGLILKQVRSCLKRIGRWSPELEQKHLRNMKSIYKPQHQKANKDNRGLPFAQKSHRSFTRNQNDNKISEPRFFEFDDNPGLYKNESEARVAKRKARAAFFRNKHNKTQFPGKPFAGKNSDTAEAWKKRDFRFNPNTKSHNYKFKDQKYMNRTDNIAANFQKRSFHMSHSVLDPKMRKKKESLLYYHAEAQNKPSRSFELLSEFNLHALDNIDIVRTLANMQKNKVTPYKNLRESKSKLNDIIALSNKNVVHKSKQHLKSNAKSVGALKARLKPLGTEARRRSGDNIKKSPALKGGARPTAGIRSASSRKNLIAVKRVWGDQSRRSFATRSAQKLTGLKKKSALAFDISKYSKFFGALKERVSLKERRQLALRNKRRGPRKQTFVRKNGLIPALFRRIHGRRSRRASSNAKLFKRVGKRIKTTYPWWMFKKYARLEKADSLEESTAFFSTFRRRGYRGFLYFRYIKLFAFWYLSFYVKFFVIIHKLRFILWINFISNTISFVSGFFYKLKAFSLQRSFTSVMYSLNNLSSSYFLFINRTFNLVFFRAFARVVYSIKLFLNRIFVKPLLSSLMLRSNFHQESNFERYSLIRFAKKNIFTTFNKPADKCKSPRFFSMSNTIIKMIRRAQLTLTTDSRYGDSETVAYITPLFEFLYDTRYHRAPFVPSRKYPKARKFKRWGRKHPRTDVRRIN